MRNTTSPGTHIPAFEWREVPPSLWLVVRESNSEIVWCMWDEAVCQLDDRATLESVQ